MRVGSDVEAIALEPLPVSALQTPYEQLADHRVEKGNLVQGGDGGTIRGVLRGPRADATEAEGHRCGVGAAQLLAVRCHRNRLASGR